MNITADTQISQSDTNTLTNADCRSFIKDLYWSFDDRQFIARSNKEFDSIELTSRNGTMQICVDVVDDGKIKATIAFPTRRFYVEHIADCKEDLNDLSVMIDRALTSNQLYV